MTERPRDFARLDDDTLDAVADEPADDAINTYAKRDPRAGQSIGAQDIAVTLFAATQPDKCWRAVFTLPEIAEIIRSDLAMDGAVLTNLVLSGQGEFTGIVASHRGGVIGFDEAIETLQRRNVRGIVYVPPDENGWRAVIPISGPREPEVFELYAARVQGLFGGKLDPAVFEPGDTIPIGGVLHLEVVEGQFLDRNDYTYATSIFRDGSTVRDRAARETEAKHELKRKGKTKPAPAARPKVSADIVALGAASVLSFTELSPNDGRYAGKQIMRDGSIEPYPHALRWNWATVSIPATMVALSDYLKAAQRRNVCLIRGLAKEGLECPTRRLKENFLDEPSRLQFFDIDGHLSDWQADPEAAVRRIVAGLGEPWASASFVWFFSGTHGLKVETIKTGKRAKHGNEIERQYWRGEIVDGKVKVRLAFILERAISAVEAADTTKLLSMSSGINLDPCVSQQTQPNYTARIKWHAHPEADVLGDTTRIGWIKGAHEFVSIPEVTASEVRWARAEGRGAASSMADHPNAITAVRAIASDGRIREHLKSAIAHLSKSNPKPPDVEVFDHAVDLADKLRDLIELHRDAVSASLRDGGRDWDSVWGYLPDNMADWAAWVIQRAPQLLRKTIKLTYEPRDDAPAANRQAIVDRVRFTVHEMSGGVTLLIAPTGTYKSTEVRKAAVAYVLANPGKTVALLVPRHDLGAEVLRKLYEEHRGSGVTAYVWRGRHREDPNFIGPTQPGKARLMCWRADEAKELEDHLVDVNSHLCQHGRGEKKIKCAFFEYCGVQRQKRIVADIWIGAHELLAHEMPKAFGDVGRIFIDEDPTDAFLFGASDAPSERVVIPLDALTKRPLNVSWETEAQLMDGRLELHKVLDAITPPADEHLGAPVPREALGNLLHRAPAAPAPAAPLDEGDFWANFFSAESSTTSLAAQMAVLEWMAKVTPPIRPTMTASQVRKLLKRAEHNSMIRKLVLLWEQLGAPGRVQIRRTNNGGRDIHVSGLRPLAEGWRGIPTLITDATADATLLRYIWPGLKCEVEEWEQLPRPGCVKVYQCVDRSLAMDAIAVYGEGEDLKRREDAARRMWAALLAKALQYGGEPVGVILYKSTENWIRDNCHVPKWITLLHHGGVAGMNVLEKVRALFVVGRLLPPAEAVTRTTEALTGEYLPERGYRRRKKAGKIAITPNAKGHNTVLTDIWEHPHPIAERVRRQVTEAGANQNEGRARANLRDENSPLDIHRWHDTPMPELGEAEAVLWDDIKGGLDELMLTVKGGAVWLESPTDAEQAHPDLISVEALRKSRQRTGAPDFAQTPSLLRFRYQRTGAKLKTSGGVSLLGEAETRAFLETRLGPLA